MVYSQLRELLRFVQINVSGIDPWPAFKFGKEDAVFSTAPMAGLGGSPLMTLFTQVRNIRQAFLHD